MSLFQAQPPPELFAMFCFVHWDEKSLGREERTFYRLLKPRFDPGVASWVFSNSGGNERCFAEPRGWWGSLGQLTDVCFPWPFQPDNPAMAVVGSLHQDLCKSSELPEAEPLWLVGTAGSALGSSGGGTEPPA